MYLYRFLLIIAMFVPFLGANIITPYEERDLELFSSANNSHPGLFAVLDTTLTSFGKQRLMHHLKNPITDVTVLRQRQHQLRLLIDNPVLLEHFKRVLAHIHEHEAGLSSFIQQKEDVTEQRILENLYFKPSWAKKYNTSSTALNALNVYKKLALFSPLLEFMLIHLAYNHGAGCGHSHGHDHGDCHDHNHDHNHKLWETIRDVHLLSHILIHLVSSKEKIENVSAQINVINEVYKRIAAARLCLGSLNPLTALMKKHGLSAASFGSAFTEKTELADFVADESITPDTSLGFFSLLGSPLKNYRLLQHNQSYLADMTQAIGDLDALVSIAEWFTKTNATEAGACFVNFIEGAERPYVNMKGFWNLGLDKKVAPNDLELGVTKPPKIVLTAQNKAGKSTIIKAAALNIILAQVYGVAAAQQVDMTVMHKVLSYINISDDISQDQSRFIAEIVRAGECVKVLKSLKSGEFAFLVIDDSLFRGTTFEKSQEVSYEFIKALGDYANCLALVATHTPVLTKLEADVPGQFKNYRIKILTTADGKPYSTFQLEEGVADVNAVFDLVNAQGYDVTFA